MCDKMLFNLSLILLLFANCYTQGQDPAASSTTLISTPGTNAETGNSSVSPCAGGHIDPPNCTKCESNIESADGKCSTIKNDSKPTGNTGRRIVLIVLACVLTGILIISMLIVYGRMNQKRRRGSATNTRNILTSSTSNTNVRNRFNNILQSTGLNNLLSRFNNNNRSSRQNPQTEPVRAPLNENPDEALLFDDPYADGGFNSASANPYKSLTLAVT